MQEYDHEWKAKGGDINERNDKVRLSLIEYIKSKFPNDPEMQTKLIPHHKPLVRRLVVDNGFYDALHRDNVNLITDTIDHISERGIVLKNSKEHEYDIIVLAGGFKVAKYFWPVKYVGRDGKSLEDLWSKDGARSYLGLSIPYFPNFFTLYGPNHQPRAGSLYSWAEIWARYAIQGIVHLIENDKKSMEVKKDVYDDYQVKLDEATKNLIWESEGASYYVNFGRNTVNSPWTTFVYHDMLEKINPADFNIK